MPEWRKDPIVERRVVVAPSRGERPCDFTPPPRARTAGPCPFCEGNEGETTRAGFEWGTDVYINTVPPEAAAAQLRDADPKYSAPRETLAARC